MARLPAIAVLILTALPLGCASRPEETLVDPAKYRFYNCAQLQRELNKLVARTQELRALHEKATRDPGGTLVSRLAYEPEYLSAIGNVRIIETTAREKNCDPPITAASDAVPPR